MSIRAKLFSTIGICVLAFTVFGAVAWNTVNSTKINGALYQEIAQGKDLVADILPPPEYIIESSLVAHQMLEETDAARLTALIDSAKKLRQDFEERHAYWSEHLPEDNIKKELLVTSYQPAAKFLDGMEKDFIPAIKARDIAKARLILRDSLNPLYEEHRKAIDGVVLQADGDLKSHEGNAAKIIASRAIWMGVIGAGSILICVVLLYLIAASISGRLGQLVGFVDAMAQGDMTQTMAAGQSDEIGHLIQACDTMRVNLRQMFKDVAQGVQTLASSSNELSAVSNQMTSSAGGTAAKASSVAAATEEMSTNMNAVATGMDQTSAKITSIATATEEMTTTVGDIARNSEKASAITGQAVGQAESISELVNGLGLSAREIGKVTETISAISSQTNLLALNATIEAARAGSAGKGFAVVAGEIKELAQQTAAATEEIKSKISGIQGSTATTVADIARISQVIQDVNEIVTSIAAAIEEQSVVTRDIASNIAETAYGVRDVNERVSQSSVASLSIARDIAQVDQSACEITASSTQVRSSAGELSRLAEQLKEMVGRFKI